MATSCGTVLEQVKDPFRCSLACSGVERWGWGWEACREPGSARGLFISSLYSGYQRET